MTDATRQATVAIVLRERIAELEKHPSPGSLYAGGQMRERRATARALAEFLRAWESPNAALQEVLDYAEARKREER